MPQQADEKPKPRQSLPPGRAQSWALVIVAVLGAGGAPSLVNALRGDGEEKAVQELSRQVAELQGAMTRLEAQAAKTETSLQVLATTVSEREQARKERDALVGSYLSQRSPDIARARELLKEP